MVCAADTNVVIDDPLNCRVVPLMVKPVPNAIAARFPVLPRPINWLADRATVDKSAKAAVGLHATVLAANWARLDSAKSPVTALVLAKLIAPKPSVVPDRRNTLPSALAAISAGSPVLLALRPITDNAELSRIMVLLTALAAMVVAKLPVPLPVTLPVSVMV